jgi:hypothetical protein
MRRGLSKATVRLGKVRFGIAIASRRRYWQVNSAGSQQAYPLPRSCSDGGGHPGILGRSPELAKRGSTDQVGLKIEGVVDRSVGGEEALG